MSTLQLKTRVLPGGRIEVQSPILPEGQEVTVHIVVQDEDRPVKKSLLENPAALTEARRSGHAIGDAPKRRISEILADYPGGRLFKSAAEVDQYIKEERESWGD